jgi:hypothetical protein
MASYLVPMCNFYKFNMLNPDIDNMEIINAFPKSYNLLKLKSKIRVYQSHSAIVYLPDICYFYKTFELFSFPRLLSMSVLVASNSSSHPVFGGVRVAHLFSFPALWCAQCWQCFLIVHSWMLQFELFQLCHGKIKSQLRCFFISKVD